MRSSPLAWGFIGFLACLLAGGLFGGPLWLAVCGGVVCLVIGAWGQNLLDAGYSDAEEEKPDADHW